jgi:outer membrane protein assembly factor BamA
MINKLLLIISFSTFLAGGQIQYVFDLAFKGNQELSTVHLKGKIRLKARGFFSKSEFSQKKLHLDEITLKNYYQTLGYIDVSISSSYNS